MKEPRLLVVARACELLEGWTGFEFRDAAPNRLADFLESRSSTLGFDEVSNYLDELSRLPGDADEPQRLINLITNGLTAFWRDEPQLEALRAVMRDLSRIRGKNTPLNIWCAGCATGEEAYTVAMVAREEEVAVSICSTDINTDFLNRAGAGRYDAWSLRRLNDERRYRWFRELGNNQLQVCEELASFITFRRHNLQEPAPLPPQRADWDIILCRNVLIYFGEDSTRRVLRHFAGALDHDDGYLILGSSEHLSGANETIFRASRAGDGFVYRSVDTKPGRSVPLNLSVPPINDEVPSLEAAQGLDEETIEFGEDDAVLALMDAGRNHLQVARYETALACFEAAAGYDPFVPEVYCLLGHALESAEAQIEALEAFQKALFLDPNLWYAAWRSARLATSLGEADVARRAYRQVARDLETGPKTTMGIRFVGHIFGDMTRVESTALDDARDALHK
jgi:chemotaxis methyl-accepting protein methylase